MPKSKFIELINADLKIGLIPFYDTLLHFKYFKITKCTNQIG